MPTDKEVLTGVLVKALNLTDEETAPLMEGEGWKEDALQSILDKRAQQVSAEKAKAKKDREEQLMRGRKEGAKKWEDFLKSEGVELGDLTGEADEAFTKVRDHIASLKVVTEPKPGDENAVKNHPAFKAREKELLKAIEAKEAEFTTKWSERDAKEQRERTLSTVKDKALAQFKARNPILPADETKAKNQLRLLELELEALDYDIEEDGTIYAKDKEGKRIETPQGAPKKFDQLVNEVADRYFEFAASEKKGSAGDISKGSKASGSFTLRKPASREEYAKMLIQIDETVTDEKERFKAKDDLKALMAT